MGVVATEVPRQTEIKRLTKENSSSKASSDTNATKIERLALQLEGAKTTISEFESTNGELKRTNADLRRQLDKWQSLETKGDAEIEDMRKRRMELEVEGKQLEDRVAELEGDLAAMKEKELKALEKERKRVAKLKEENDRMAVSTHSNKDNNFLTHVFAA